MREIKEIIAEYDVCRKNQELVAMAVIVHVEGSSYRRPGARMLITASGKVIGAISGGCLESDVLRKAQLVIHRSQPLTARYDTRNEEELDVDSEDEITEKNPGCEGVITIVVLPIDFEDKQNPVELLKVSIQKRTPAVICTPFTFKKNAEPSKSTQGLLGTEEEILLDPGWEYTTRTQSQLFLMTYTSNEVMIDYAKRCVNESAHQWMVPLEKNNDPWIFFEYFQPVPHLIIIGSGPDAIPLSRLAEQMGWDISLTDSKARQASMAQFSSSCRYIPGNTLEVVRNLKPDNHTIIVLLTHNYHYDKLLLPFLIQTDCMYVGMIGPKTKREKILKEIKHQGYTFASEELEKLHCPAGIDIGAESPQEIALSIVAEILAKRTKKNAPFLRNRDIPIH